MESGAYNDKMWVNLVIWYVDAEKNGHHFPDDIFKSIFMYEID